MLLVLIFYFIFKLIILKRTSNKALDYKNEKNLVKNFNNLLDKVTEQETEEILECLLEMEQLDKIYQQITEKNLCFLDEIEYLKIKEDKLDNIIQNKIDNIKPVRGKKTKLRSLQGEIRSCKKRFPLYNTVFVKYINKINKMLKTSSK